FIHAASHDFKAPITALLGFSALLYEEIKQTSSKEISHYTRRMVDNSKLLEKMINELLYISRLKIKKVEALDTVVIIKEAMVPLQWSISQKKLDVKINKMPPIIADREHLLRLFNQLLSNAVKFSPSGKKIFAGFDKQEFYLRDEAGGIKPENLDRVFNIFFTTESKNTMSTGAGLYIAKKIVELYNGTIRIESKWGKGTTVYFKLPPGK
ncbi:MAG: sensor histidine kinase, partial [Spirochaetota bacterium]